MSQGHDQHSISLSPPSLPNSNTANPFDWLHDTELCHQLKVNITASNSCSIYDLLFPLDSILSLSRC